MNLPQDWGYQIIKQVGNYGEIFNRTVGMNSPLKIDLFSGLSGCAFGTTPPQNFHPENQDPDHKMKTLDRLPDPVDRC